MAQVAAHLSVSELEGHYRAAKEATAARHYQAIWLLDLGRLVSLAMGGSLRMLLTALRFCPIL